MKDRTESDGDPDLEHRHRSSSHWTKPYISAQWLREQVEGMKHFKSPVSFGDEAYNQALDDVLSLLGEKE